MVWRASRSTKGFDLLFKECQHAVFGQKSRGALIQEGLVGGPATLCHEQELIFVFAIGKDVDLRWQVVGGVLFFEHLQWCQLAVAQVLLVIGVKHTLADGAFI